MPNSLVRHKWVQVNIQHYNPRSPHKWYSFPTSFDQSK